MAKINWVFQDEMGTNLNRYKATNVDTGETVTFDLNRGGSITIQGTPLNAEKMNSLISAINSAYDELSRCITTSGGTISGDLQVDGNLKIKEARSSNSDATKFLAFATNGVFYDKNDSYDYSDDKMELAVRGDFGETITVYEGNTKIKFSQDEVASNQLTRLGLPIKLGYSDYEVLRVYIKGGTQNNIGDDFMTEFPITRKLIGNKYYVRGSGINFVCLNQFALIGVEVAGDASTTDFYGADCTLNINVYNLNSFTPDGTPIEAKEMYIAKVELIRKHENLGR